MIPSLSCRSRLGLAIARALIAAPLVAMGHSAAEAQTPGPTQRPYRGVFAPSTSEDRRFDMLWSVAGVYDDNVSTDMAGYDPRLRLGGGYGMAAATVNYSVKRRTIFFGATGRTNARYYPNLADLNVIDGSGGIAVTTDVSRRLKLSFSQNLSYQPYYQFGFMSGVAPSQVAELERIPTSSSPTTQTVGSISADGQVQLVQSIGRRSSLSTDYGYRYSKLETSRDSFLWQLANARFTKPVTRYAALRLGYGYGLTSNGLVLTSDPATVTERSGPIQTQNAVTAPSESIVTQNIDVGMTYTKPLSQTRRTYLNVTPGTSIVDYAGKQHFVLLTNAGLTHNFGASWNAILSYDRGMQFVEGIAGPLYADTVHVRIGGLMARSVELALASMYSSGSIGLGAADPGYDTYGGVVTVRVAISRSLSLEAQYRHSQYLFDEGAPLLAGLPRTMVQHGLRFGITGWVPFQR